MHMGAQISDSIRCGGIATDGVSAQNFRHWSAETRANRL